MKTIEERAAEAIANFVAKEQSLLYGKGGYGASFVEWSSRLGEEIEKAMRELVEDARKIAAKRIYLYDPFKDREATLVINISEAIARLAKPRAEAEESKEDEHAKNH